MNLKDIKKMAGNKDIMDMLEGMANIIGNIESGSYTIYEQKKALKKRH